MPIVMRKMDAACGGTLPRQPTANHQLSRTTTSGSGTARAEVERGEMIYFEISHARIHFPARDAVLMTVASAISTQMTRRGHSNSKSRRRSILWCDLH